MKYNRTDANYVFKIRRKSDRLFSMGGCNPRFSTIGKTWSSRSNLNQHLALFDTRESLAKAYHGCEIVVYSEISSINIVE